MSNISDKDRQLAEKISIENNLPIEPMFKCFIADGKKESQGERILNTIEQYHEAKRKEDACAFAEWIYKSGFVKYWGSDVPNCNKWYRQYSMPDRRYFTTNELFELYLKETESK